MLGKVISVNNVDELGFIEGFDGLKYRFHFEQIINNDEKIKIEDYVEFDYLLQSLDKIPYAVRIRKFDFNNEIDKKKEQKKVLIQNEKIKLENEWIYNNKIQKKAYKELLEIIKYIPQKEVNKIPKEFIKHLEDNMDNSHDFKFNSIKELKANGILYETKVLLSILFINYWANDEDKKEILKLEREELQKIEEEKQRIYEDIYERNKKNSNKEEIEENLQALIKIKDESIFEKIIKFIKEFFNKAKK